MTDTHSKKTTEATAGEILHGKRIILRRPAMNDAARVFHWERDDEVWRYDIHRPYSHTMAEFLPIFERNYVHGNGRQFWFIIDDETGTPIGTITYFNLDHHSGQVEVGLGLGEKISWGKGYGPEAIGTLVQHLFTYPGIVRVYAETALANHPSKRAFSKVGFTEVGQIYDARSTGDPWVLLEIWKPGVQ